MCVYYTCLKSVKVVTFHSNPPTGGVGIYADWQLPRRHQKPFWQVAFLSFQCTVKKATMKIYFILLIFAFSNVSSNCLLKRMHKSH